MKIDIREKACQVLAEKLTPRDFLRVSVTEGGCAGLTYDAEIGQELKAGEGVLFEENGLRIVAEDKNKQFLDGLTIDYSDDLIGGGLQLTNTRAKSTCGCGASFNLSGFPVIDKGTCGK